MRRSGAVVAVLLVLVALAAAGGAWWVLDARARAADRQAALDLVADLSAALETGDLDGLPLSAPTAPTQLAAVTEGLGPATVGVTPGEVAVDDAGARVDLDVRWSLADGAVWQYTTPVELVRTDVEESPWRVAWSPTVIHPDLGEDEVLTLDRTQPVRGDVLDLSGEAIVTPRPVVEISVDTTAVTDTESLATDLGELLDIDGPALAERLADAGPAALVPVITLRESDWTPVSADLAELPGIVTIASERPLAPTREFARAFLGSVGEVTAEQLEAEPGRYVEGDIVGRSGLQETFDERLRGRAGVVVTVEPADDPGNGDDTTEAAGEEATEDEATEEGATGEEAADESTGEDDGNGDGDERVLFEVDPQDGQDVTVTLRGDVQQAADDALSGVENPSAIVAVDVPSGDVVAVANGPGAGFDIATQGQYPPGSTFKIVTTAELLAGGLSPDDVVGCPATVTVDGRDFRNAADAELGDVPFRTAFAQSCNTAFVGLSQDLAPGDLQATAQEYFGIGSRSGLGIGAFAGEVPVESDPTDVAATSLGQGRVLVSPLVAADVAATVARGQWLEPRVVVGDGVGDGDPGAAGDSTDTTEAPTDATTENGATAEATAEPTAGDADSGGDAGAEAEPGSGPPLPGDGALQDLTRAVVTEGSGTAVAEVPGGEVHGKTGTAQFGSGDDAGTHAWFIGYQGDVAFAVLVAETDNGFGGEVAAPIAADFLASLAGAAVGPEG